MIPGPCQICGVTTFNRFSRPRRGLLRILDALTGRADPRYACSQHLPQAWLSTEGAGR